MEFRVYLFGFTRNNNIVCHKKNEKNKYYFISHTRITYISYID